MKKNIKNILKPKDVPVSQDVLLDDEASPTIEEAEQEGLEVQSSEDGLETIQEKSATVKGLDIGPDDDTVAVPREALMAELERRDESALNDLTCKPNDKYKFRRSIGQGGMKTVLSVRDKDTAREVAMAIMTNADERPVEDINRFVHEARITARLEHPNIVPIHDIGVDGSGTPYFTMKMLRGETLASILRKIEIGDLAYVKKYDLLRLLQIFLRVCNAVAFAHSKGVIHLDLKPENVQVGDFGEVLVLDWGLAKIIGTPDDEEPLEGMKLRRLKDMQELKKKSPEVTMDGITKGTPGYMAPEQAAGKNRKKDERTDIYALGVMLYTILIRKNPFSDREVDDILNDTLDGNILPPREQSSATFIPSALEAVAMKAMSLNPKERYQNVRDIRSDIYAFMGGFATEAEKASFFKRALLLIKRHRLATTFLAIILFLMTTFGIYALYDLSRQKGDWVEIYSVDFAEPDFDLNDFIFMDKLNRNTTKPWLIGPYGLEMRKGEWLWLDNIRIPENIKVVLRVICNDNPNALEVCVNSRIEKLKQWYFVPTGYSFQFGGHGGTRDLIFRNDDASAPEVIYSVESKLKTGKIHEVVFSRKDRNLSMSIDGDDNIKATDFFPPLGSDLNRVGFRTYSDSMRLISISVYRLTLPEKASPLIAGDVLVEKQHFEEAIDKYLTIAENYGENPVAEKALTKAYVNASVHLPEDKRDKVLLDIRKTIFTLFPGFKYREQILEVDALVYWRQKEYRDTFRILPEIFQINPNTNVIIRLLQGQHHELPEDVGMELLSWVCKTRNLKRLNLTGLGLKSLEPIKDLSLSFLDCSDNHLTDLKALSKMSLEMLSCSNNQITDLSPLKGMPLKDLNCMRNKISDLSPLKGMPLEILNCGSNPIKSISPLAGMNLKVLDLADCRELKNIDALKGMESLEQLAIPGGLQDISFLRSLPELKTITTSTGIWTGTSETAEEFWQRYK
jgi:serine/threonine protein kinase/Leucine-rich repeat (LRR) protein